MPLGRDDGPATVRALALGGIVGPAAFVGAWVTAGAITSLDVSPIDDAISRLAAVGSDTRVLMSAGLVVFGCGLVSYAVALRRVVGGPAWIAAATTGIATLGVAATPLDHSGGVDALHAVFATVCYVSLVAVPALAARPLRRCGQRGLAGAGVLAAAVSAVCLATSVAGLPTGLLQRVGLTSSDLWIAASAVAIVRSGGRRR
ncbi:hypothetical protein BH23ACT3_BH23ACT3_22410 [soil metagenome]